MSPSMYRSWIDVQSGQSTRRSAESRTHVRNRWYVSLYLQVMGLNSSTTIYSCTVVLDIFSHVGALNTS